MTSHCNNLSLAGYMPSLATPFDAAGKIDRAAFEHLCAWQIAAGAPALFVGGLTGEAPTLSRTEHGILIQIAVDVTQHRIPVVADAGSNSTAQAIEMTHDAERLGADAVLSVVPYYNKPGPKGILAHFNAIRRSTSLPIILHDAPSRCASALRDGSVGELANESQFAGLLDGSGDLSRPSRLRQLVGDRFLLLSGDELTGLAYQALGGNGCVSTTANVVPKLFRDLSLAVRRDDMLHAQRLAISINEITTTLGGDSEVASIKYALSLFGIARSSVRLPLVEPPTDRKRQIEDMLLHLHDHDPHVLVPRKHAVAAPA